MGRWHAARPGTTGPEPSAAARLAPGCARGKPRTIDGTLYFGGDGNVFDQILVSKRLLAGANPLKVQLGSARIEAIPEMVDHRVSEGPIRFGLPKGDAVKNVDLDGFSDHFHVSVRLTDG